MMFPSRLPADSLPPPTLRPPRALAIASALMAHLATIDGSLEPVGADVASRRCGFGLGPLRKKTEEAGDVFDDLPRIFAAELTP
jgi:hypothetical protein